MDGSVRDRPTLEAEEVSFGYTDEVVVDRVSLEALPGEMTAVVGPNGSGKSTLLKLLCGLIHPSAGRVAVKGEDIETYSARKLARHVAYVPQEFHLSAPFTVRQVVLTGRHPHLPPLAFEGERDLRIVDEAIERMALTALAKRPFQELSGGERQRTLVAAALAQQPEALILDEPTSSLDLGHQVELMRLLSEHCRTHRLTVLAALHDLNLASGWFPSLVLLGRGRVLGRGAPADVLTEKNLQSLYGDGAVVVSAGRRTVILPAAPRAHHHARGPREAREPGSGGES
jgi:iron complex transport system ATP-binding protein